MTHLKSVYDNVYGTLDYGPITTARGLALALEIAPELPKGASILCVGSGNSYEAVSFRQRGFNVYTTDYEAPDVPILKDRQVIAQGQYLPYKDNTFDVVFCAECIEHIPDDEIELFLIELHRVCKNRFYYTVADRDDPPYHTHICLHDVLWWEKKLEELQYKILNIQIKPMHHYTIFQDDQVLVFSTRFRHGMIFRCVKA